MPVTIAGAASSSGPRAEAAAFVQVKQSWGDEWLLDLQIEALSANCHSGAMGADAAEFLFRYGIVKGEYESAAVAREPRKYRNYWVRVLLAGAQGIQVVWQGRMEAERRSIEGADAAQSGMQFWQAAGGARILQRIRVSSSYWDIGGADVRLEHMPSINLQDRGGPTTGNRNATPIGGTYCYGKDGTTHEFGLWTHYDYLEYLLARYVNGSGRPVFTLGGQASLLRSWTSYVPLQPTMWAYDIIRKLISPQMGVDFAVVPNETGYEIRVFTLSPWEESFGGISVPANPNLVTINQASDASVVECKTERTTAQCYDRITVIGERAKVVGTVFLPSSLWPAALEASYLDGTGDAGDDAVEHDLVRADDSFRTVFQALGAYESWTPADWNASPSFNTDGTLAAVNTPCQTAIRKTLPHLLLREGWDYTTNPPTPPAHDSGYDNEESFLPPLVLGLLVDAALAGGQAYVPVDKIAPIAEEIGLWTPNCNVRNLTSEWGVLVEASPNHVLGRNHWSGANDSGFDPDTQGGLDWEDCVITIAWEGDYRQILRYDQPSDYAAGDGSELVLEVPGAEYWYLAQGTVLGVDAAGALRSAPAGGVVLRDDIERLKAVMAGAIARYSYDRLTGYITYLRLENWTQQVGTILAFIDEGDDMSYIGAPVTTIAWDFVKRTTTVRSGYAQ